MKRSEEQGTASPEPVCLQVLGENKQILCISISGHSQKKVKRPASELWEH